MSDLRVAPAEYHDCPVAWPKLSTVGCTVTRIARGGTPAARAISSRDRRSRSSRAGRSDDSSAGSASPMSSRAGAAAATAEIAAPHQTAAAPAARHRRDLTPVMMSEVRPYLTVIGTVATWFSHSSRSSPCPFPLSAIVYFSVSTRAVGLL